MKLITILNVVLSCSALLLTGLLISSNQQNIARQAQSQELILQIQHDQQTRQVTGKVATNIVKDMAQLSIQNQSLKQLLQNHGFNVQVRK
jgi:flagellar basal body-associated protein FliL